MDYNIEIKYKPSFWHHPTTMNVEHHILNLICNSNNLEILSELVGIVDINIPGYGAVSDIFGKIGDFFTYYQKEKQKKSQIEIKNNSYFICERDWNSTKEIMLLYLSIKKNVVTYNKKSCNDNKPIVLMSSEEGQEYYLCELNEDPIESRLNLLVNNFIEFIEISITYMNIKTSYSVAGVIYGIYGTINDIKQGIPIVEMPGNFVHNVIAGPTVLAGKVGKIAVDNSIKLIIDIYDNKLTAYDILDNYYIKHLVSFVGVGVTSIIISWFIENAGDYTLKQYIGNYYTSYFSKLLTKATKKIVEHKMAYDTEWIYLVQSPARCEDHALNGNKPKYYKEEVIIDTDGNNTWYTCYKKDTRPTEHIDYQYNFITTYIKKFLDTESCYTYNKYINAAIDFTLSFTTAVPFYLLTPAITTHLLPNLYPPILTFLNIGIPIGTFFGTWSLIESLEKYKLINDEQLLAFNYIKNSNKTNLYMAQYPGHCLNKDTYGYIIQNNLTNLPKDFIGISFYNDEYKFRAKQDAENKFEIGIICGNNNAEKDYITYLNTTIELPKLLFSFCPNLLDDTVSQVNKGKILDLLTEENLIQRPIMFEVKINDHASKRSVIDREQTDIISIQLYQKISDILLYNLEDNLTPEDKTIIFDHLYERRLVQNHTALQYFNNGNNILKWTVCEIAGESHTAGICSGDFCA